uniref:Endoplasmic reticulum lectin 1 n=1 Tax=Timema monikensis TaxID=170555 RepID=A0A7R9E4R8_9NEOP|nr:unnamed protein product [Timema monikensis]
MIFSHLCVLYLTFYVTTSIDIKNFDDTVLFKINWPGRNGNELLDTLDAETLVVSSENNEKYKCLLPHFQEKEKDTIDTYSGPSPLQLLQPLFTQLSCSYRLESYWTYEVCHGRYVRQYHEEREGKKVKLQEYYLGRLDNTQFGKELEYLDNRAAEDMPVKKIDGLNMPYLQLNMSDGTECDLNGKKRMTKALYVCYLHGKHEVYSIKETSTCEPQESGENVINCHPLERAAKKPRSLLAMEAESLKLKHQKITDDEKLQKVFAIFSIDKEGEGQEGETRVRVEIRPVDVTVNQEELASTAAAPKPPPSIKDTSPVSSFLSGKSCLTGGSGWWKYEFCYGLSVDQYHLEKDGSKTTINLGRFDRNDHIEWLVKNPHKRPKPSALRKQISHFYAGGGLCEETGHPRQTEVSCLVIIVGTKAVIPSCGFEGNWLMSRRRQRFVPTCVGRGRKKVGKIVPAKLVAMEQKDVPSGESVTDGLENIDCGAVQAIEGVGGAEERCKGRLNNEAQQEIAALSVRRHVICYMLPWCKAALRSMLFNSVMYPPFPHVKLKCLDNSSSPGSVSLYLLEPKTCEYILGVESPVICNLLPHVDENGLVELNPGSEDEYMTVSLEDEPAGDDLDNTIANGDD